jgi:hypothetical protein
VMRKQVGWVYPVGRGAGEVGDVWGGPFDIRILWSPAFPGSTWYLTHKSDLSETFHIKTCIFFLPDRFVLVSYTIILILIASNWSRVFCHPPAENVTSPLIALAFTGTQTLGCTIDK